MSSASRRAAFAGSHRSVLTGSVSAAAIVRIRLGDTDREIAHSGLMARKKAAQVRRLARSVTSRKMGNLTFATPTHIYFRKQIFSRRILEEIIIDPIAVYRELRRVTQSAAARIHDRA